MLYAEFQDRIRQLPRHDIKCVFEKFIHPHGYPYFASKLPSIVTDNDLDDKSTPPGELTPTQLLVDNITEKTLLQLKDDQGI